MEYKTIHDQPGKIEEAINDAAMEGWTVLSTTRTSRTLDNANVVDFIFVIMSRSTSHSSTHLTKTCACESMSIPEPPKGPNPTRST